jgi:2-C-methyl-D-erythritol 2,4-cyclodiphosphate synthase
MNKEFPRTGFGYDIHRFEEGRKFVLGGVVIPHPRGLAGHSDADVLLHAICDALLGASALGDIGKHFPNSSRKYKNISSLKLLREVKGKLLARGYVVVNVDSMVVLQRPRISKHIPAMVKKISAALGVELSQVSVKATTNEGMGFLGRGAGCSAFAVATIIKRASRG